MRRVGAPHRGGERSAEEGGEDRPAGELAPILYVDDLARFLGRTPKAIRAAVTRKQLPPPIRLAGRLAWRAPDVLTFVAELHATRQSSPPLVHISAEHYHHDPTRFRVVFELSKQPGRPRRRIRKLAPTGLDHAQALAWARQSEPEVLREFLKDRDEVEATMTEAPPRQRYTSPARSRPSADVPTLAVFWERFAAEYLAKLKPATRRGYESCFANYLGPVLGAYRLDSIDRVALAALKQAIGQLPGVGSRNQVLYKLRKVFERAVAWYILRADQVPAITVDKEGKRPEPVVYTDEQAERLVAAALELGDDACALVLLLLHGGLRVSEVAALRWSDLDLAAGLMIIQHNFSAGEAATPKGGEAAPVGLTPDLAAVLARLPRRGEHVLVRQRRGELAHHTAHSITYHLNKVQAHAGLPETGPHLLRHTGLTMLARRGCDPWRLQAHARHARVATTQRYVHLARELSAREAVAFWSQPQAASPTAASVPPETDPAKSM